MWEIQVFFAVNVSFLSIRMIEVSVMADLKLLRRNNETRCRLNESLWFDYQRKSRECVNRLGECITKDILNRNGFLENPINIASLVLIYMLYICGLLLDVGWIHREQAYMRYRS